MCYDIQTMLERQLKYYRTHGGKDAEPIIQDILKDLKRLNPNNPLYEYFHVSGFQHPKLVIVKDNGKLAVAQWGLVPSWVKDQAAKEKLWNSTLNARGETIFEKPSFKQAARTGRCLIYVDGFYESHHLGGNTYPYFFAPKDPDQLFILGGISSEWVDKETGEIIETFSIVTTPANELFKLVHNNPKLPEPRMPLVLSEEEAKQWLEQKINGSEGIADVMKLIKPAPINWFKFNNVRKLRGKEYVGNQPKVSEPVEYPELTFANLELERLTD
ncbi:MAG: SOS response-associated peptidase [Flavobacteriales bacterium]|nr:SOS response-associated peptidase [Flavobacteriales bacterium]MCB9198682.1 SOS response-associated peptidase [Flavobacteriales bacterium]